MDEREIFNVAIERTDPHERAAWLKRACGNDVALLQRVRALLRNHDPKASWLERPPADICDAPTLFDGDTADDQASADGRVDATGGRSFGEVNLDFLEPSDASGSLGRLGVYEVQEVIGRGGMGIVLEALDPSLNRVVAVKVLAPEHTHNAKARTRFLREARAVAAVPHPHIVSVYSVHKGPIPFIVMEFVSGKPLSDLVSQSERMDEQQIVEIAIQIARALAAAHARGLIHRDIKPANVLIESGTGRVKITDFGLARVADDVDVTRTGEVTGTPRYMSPEHAQGLPVDGRTDLFSLGGTLYAISCGRPPFDANTVVAVLRLICDEPHVPVQHRNPEISSWLSEFIDRLLAKQPADRFQSAGEVVELLEGYQRHLKEPTSDSAPSFDRGIRKPERRSWKCRRRRWMFGIAMGLVLLPTFFPTLIMRLVVGQGTLIIQVDDPAVKVSVKGDGVNIQWDGNDIKLRPGDYTVIATRDGEIIKSENVSITRNGETLFSVKEETPPEYNHPIAKILTSPDLEWSEPMNLGPYVNSSSHESRGVLTDDELRIVFSRSRRLWEATREDVDRPFGPARELVVSIHDDWYPGSPWLSPDGLSLAFGRARSHREPLTILMARRPAVDQPFGTPVDTEIIGKHPVLTEDQRAMIFVQGGGHGLSHLSFCRRSAADVPFADAPQKLQYPRTDAGLKHNMPVVSPDGDLVLFAGNSGKAVWLMERLDNEGRFAAPARLNLPFEDAHVIPDWLSRDGRRLYVGVSREGVHGADLYQLTRVPRSSAERSATTEIDSSANKPSSAAALPK